jgi:malic enzyme
LLWRANSAGPLVGCFSSLGRRENAILVDTKGVIYQGRTEGMNQWKSAHAVRTQARTLEEAQVQVIEGSALHYVENWKRYRRDLAASRNVP